MRRALALAVVLPLLLAAPVVAAPSKVVTRAEYDRVKPGATRDKVERVFGAGRGCVFDTSRSDEGKRVRVQYLQQRNPRLAGDYYAVVNYVEVDGTLRVVKLPGDRYKEWTTNLAC